MRLAQNAFKSIRSPHVSSGSRVSAIQAHRDIGSVGPGSPPIRCGVGRKMTFCFLIQSERTMI